jgi:hypothetical protein
MPGMTRFPVVRIVEFCARYPWPVLVSAAVIAAAAGFYAVDHFATTTNVSNLLHCVRDEESARQQLNALWASTPVPMRNRCKSDARSLGTMSYLDLLACLQIATDTNPSPKKVAQKQ